MEIDPTILVEGRYFGHHNFLGRPVAGYETGRCLLTRAAATALAKVQADLKQSGYTLKTYDCYRPQRAVADFIGWAKDIADQKMKTEFFPRVDKTQVFQLGYVASKSGHSRGSTVDLTLVKLPVTPSAEFKKGGKLVDCTASYAERFKDNSLDMGTGYDCFDDKAATANSTISGEAKVNRQRLKSAMEKHGFTNYEKEWWHFILKNEPHPDTYFDVPN